MTKKIRMCKENTIHYHDINDVKTLKELIKDLPDDMLIYSDGIEADMYVCGDSNLLCFETEPDYYERDDIDTMTDIMYSFVDTVRGQLNIRSKVIDWDLDRIYFENGYVIRTWNMDDNGIDFTVFNDKSENIYHGFYEI